MRRDGAQSRPTRAAAVLLGAMLPVIAGVITGLGQGLLLGIAAGIAAVVLALVLLDWRKLYLVAFLAMTVQGIVSLALPGQSWAVLMADAIVALTIVKWGFWAFRRGDRPPVGLAITGPYAVLSLWSVLQTLNPAIPDPLMAVIGLRTLLMYPPLVWVTFAYVRTWDDARRWMLVTIGLGCLSSVVAAYEYLRGAEWYASLGPGFRAAYLQVGADSTLSGDSVFRASGTFSAPGHFGAMLIPLLLLAVAAVVTSQSVRGRLLAGGALVTLTAGLFANSQRAAVVIFVMGSIAVVAVALRRFSFRTLILLPSVVIVAVVAAGQVAGGTFFDRVLSFAMDPGDVILRRGLVDPLVERLGSAISATLIGNGIGTATAGARYLGPIWMDSESYVAALWYELGVIGVVLFFAGLTALLWQLLRAWAATVDARAKVFVTATVAYSLGMVAMMGTYAWLHYPPTLMLLWSMIGLGLRLSDLGSVRDA